MESFSKENPGSVYDMLNYIAELGNESKFVFHNFGPVAYNKETIPHPVNALIGIDDLMLLKPYGIYRFKELKTLKKATEVIICDGYFGETKVRINYRWDVILLYGYKPFNKFKWFKAIKPAGELFITDDTSIEVEELEGKFFAKALPVTKPNESPSNEEIIKFLTS